MKKLFLALIATASVAAANAQSESSILVYGNAGFNTQTDASKNNTMNWNVSPGIGYSFNKQWTVGVAGGYASSSSKDSGSTRSSYNEYRIGVFGRYTQHIGDIFAIYGQLDAGYESEHAKEAGVSTNLGHGFYGNLAPYVEINVCHGFALNFAFGGLTYESFKQTGASSSISTFGITFGQQMNFGISKHFGCGHKMAKHHREPMEDTRQMDTKDDGDGDDDTKKKKKKSDDE